MTGQGIRGEGQAAIAGVHRYPFVGGAESELVEGLGKTALLFADDEGKRYLHTVDGKYGATGKNIIKGQVAVGYSPGMVEDGCCIDASGKGRRPGMQHVFHLLRIAGDGAKK